MSSYVPEYGYPFCLGQYVPVKLNRDPKWIKPCTRSSSLLPVCVSMPHAYYLQFMKWANQQLKNWWRCQLMRGTFTSDPGARHNLEPVPSYVKFFLTWIVAYDARGWSSAGIRWMLWEVFGSLGEECMKYVNYSSDSGPELDPSKSVKKMRVVAYDAISELLSAETTTGVNGFSLFSRDFVMRI